VSIRKNSLAVTSACLVLVALVSCTKHVTVLTSEPANLVAPEGLQALPITGYTTSDGVFHEFNGTVRVNGDSLEFYAPGRDARGLELAKPEKSFKLATGGVTSVKTPAKKS
jgi:hypothetical protein